MVGASEVVMFEGAQRARRWSWPSLRWAGWCSCVHGRPLDGTVVIDRCRKNFEPRRRLQAERVVRGGGIDDEGPLQLVGDLGKLAHGSAEQRHHTQKQGWYLAHLDRVDTGHQGKVCDGVALCAGGVGRYVPWSAPRPFAVATATSSRATSSTYVQLCSASALGRTCTSFPASRRGMTRWPR